MDFLFKTYSLVTFLSRFGYNYVTQSGQMLCWVCTDILLVDPETGERRVTAMEDLFYGRRLIQEQSLGSYHDISARQFCPMCRLVFQLLSNDKRLLPSNSSPAATGGACVIQQDGATPMELRLTYVTSSPSSHYRLRPRGRIVVLSNKYPLPSGNYWQERQRFTEYYLHTHRSARSSELLDIDFVRYCLASCEQKHTSCSHPESHKTSGRSPADIFLVNVEEECIEPGTTALRYLALSYVWGDGRFYKTRSADVPILRKHGSLAPSAKLFNMPGTVRDAMTLVKQLGEKYLWVDALCIIQDDDTHRTQQLRLMDIIYRHSVMTVIALSGEDARSGLPGVGSGLRRRIMPVESIEGEAFSLTIEPPHLRYVVDLSTWSTRAWTFQEQLLSRRCLYLSDCQAYFQCQGTTVEESARPQDNNLNRPGAFENHGGYSLNKANPLIKMVCWDDGYNSYQKLVGYYLRRSMTRESDILNAFEGVSAFMQAQLGGSFFAGVPEAAIDFCLLWAPANDITRRRVPGFDIPSWSWAGWKGQADQTWDISFLWDTLGVGLGHVSEGFLPYWPRVLRSEIDAMLVEVNGALVEVNRIVQMTTENQAHPASDAEPIRRGSGQLDTLKSLAAAAQLGGHQHLLHVLTQTASPKGFSVAGGQVIGRRMKPYHMSESITQQATHLFNSTGRVCGLVFDREQNCVWDFDDDERYGFVLLSRALRDKSCATSSILDIVESGGAMRQVVVGAGAVGPDEGKWDVLFVLLVEWQGRSKSCCQRLAICQMSALAWEAARPQRRYIRLG